MGGGRGGGRRDKNEEIEKCNSYLSQYMQLFDINARRINIYYMAY